jgi:hypothetical protein
MVARRGTDAGGRNLLNRVFAQVDQGDVVTVEGFIVAVVEELALGA